MNIYLASASATRKKLLKEILTPLGLEFEVIPAKIEEGIEKIGKITREETAKLVVELARQKAKVIAKKLKKGGKSGLIIAADTLIWFKNKLYGKPADLVDAFATLNMFRGQVHWAFTGMVVKGHLRSRIERSPRSGIRGISDKEKAVCAKAKVYMKKISDEELRRYVETKEPLGKAGSYAILQKADKFFKVLEGEPSTVAGLPIERLKELLPDFGI